MRLALILLTLILFNSCGEDAAPVQGCEATLSGINRTWTSDTTGRSYDVSTCTAGTLCEFSDGFCNTVDEIQLLYNDAGGIAYTTCGNNITYSGNWRVCGNVLEFYNMSDNADETFR